MCRRAGSRRGVTGNTTPPSLAPWHRMTFAIVKRKILASNRSDQWSTYQMSYRNLWSHSIAFRPLNLHQSGEPGTDLRVSGFARRCTMRDIEQAAVADRQGSGHLGARSKAAGARRGFVFRSHRPTAVIRSRIRQQPLIGPPGLAHRAELVNREKGSTGSQRGLGGILPGRPSDMYTNSAIIANNEQKDQSEHRYR